tara:strand:+ start:315 stop:635 length:321 start_codon:yes stop_codon:yes gene_type:complete
MWKDYILIPKINKECVMAVCNKAMIGPYAGFVNHSKEMIQEEQPILFDQMQNVIKSSVMGSQEVLREKSADIDSPETTVLMEAVVWASLGIMWKATKATIESESMK